jgi:myo-inositol 2-dehydrogenase/D-chiro-inositol 1-dehydrogenase
MRMGVVGLGRIGGMHAANVAATEGVDEVLLYSEPADQAAKVVAELGGRARAMGSLGELLAEADGVVIATPTPTHPELVRAAVAAGVPVMCEKPLAMDRATLVEVAREVEGGVPVMVAFPRRYDPAHQELRRRVAAGEAGRVHHLRAAGHDRVPPPPAFVPTSGGIWRDLLIHDFDVMPWIAGERVVEVFATGSVLVDPVYAESGDADTAVAVLRFASGALGVVTGARKNGQGYDFRLEVCGSRATLAAGVDARTPVVSLEPGVEPPADPYQGFADRYGHAYRAEVAHLVRLVRGETGNLSPPLDGLHALEIAEACERSVATRGPVRIGVDGVLTSA